MQHNPASAFFYILTWAHAAHVIGALAALYYVAGRMLFFPAIPMNRNGGCSKCRVLNPEKT